jgi:hypothetical protein
VCSSDLLKLPSSERDVEVFIYLATLTPQLVSKISYPDVRLDTYKYSNPALPEKKGKVVTSDEHLYLLADRKRSIITEFQKLMKESAFDCTLNYHDNKLNAGKKGMLTNSTLINANGVKTIHSYTYDGWGAIAIDETKEGSPEFTFTVGAGQVIAGWDEGFLLMKEGDKLQLIIPWTLAYGPRGSGPIPPYSTLMFEITLVKVYSKK